MIPENHKKTWDNCGKRLRNKTHFADIMIVNAYIRLLILLVGNCNGGSRAGEQKGKSEREKDASEEEERETGGCTEKQD